ncbi:hypothetical protein [Nocardia rhizosphaerae]|uniref:Uncharacterized protein n=1 Tax=Nocardia rhizosphaerae TaxID=1691571 RepID=A0ABV8L314_9NOCA
MTTPDPIVTVTAYAVSCLPEGHPARRHYRLDVRRQGDRWVIEQGGEYLNLDGSWSADPWLFESAESALVVAQHHAPRLTVDGRTAADVLGGAR